MHQRWRQTTAKIKGMWPLCTEHNQAKKSSATLTMVGLNNIRAVYIASSKFSDPKRFVWRLNKVE